MNEELQQLLDREKIRDCLARLARGEDRRCDDRIRRCFWKNAHIDLGFFTGKLTAYIDLVVPGDPAVKLTQRSLSQTLIYLDGEFAATETQVTCYHRVHKHGKDHDYVIGGRYLDKLERRDGDWKILHRTMMYDWQKELGEALDWSNGVMGNAFLSDQTIGVTFEDYSERFFKEVVEEE